MAPTTTDRPTTGLAEKLAAKADEISAKPAKPKAEMIIDETAEAISFYVRKVDLLNNIGKSSTGESEGVTLSAVGDFTYTVNGRTYSFKLAMRGGWATVKMVSGM
jgi:hypothetical protein